jgi:cell division protein ZapA
MKESTDGVTVTILGKEFRVACPANERNALVVAASYLDTKLREIQASGKVIGTERTAIITALNIAHELLELRSSGGLPDDAAQKVRLLRNKIDAVLRQDGQARQ